MKKDPKKRAAQKRRPMHESRLSWQKGAYDRRLQLTLLLPYQFLLICRLLEVTPADVIYRFLLDLDCGSWKREGREEARSKVVEYFMEYGYGHGHYRPEEIRQMFHEMNTIGMLFPDDSSPDLVDLHVAWRDRYHEYWFQKWFDKVRRPLFWSISTGQLWNDLQAR